MTATRGKSKIEGVLTVEPVQTQKELEQPQDAKRSSQLSQQEFIDEGPSDLRCCNCTHCDLQNQKREALKEASHQGWVDTVNSVFGRAQLSHVMANQYTENANLDCSTPAPTITLLQTQLAEVSEIESCTKQAPELIVHSHDGDGPNTKTTLSTQAQKMWPDRSLCYTIRRARVGIAFGYVLVRDQCYDIHIREDVSKFGVGNEDNYDTIYIEAFVVDTNGNELWPLSSLEVKWLFGVPIAHLIRARRYDDFWRGDPSTPCGTGWPPPELRIHQQFSKTIEPCSEWLCIAGDYFNKQSGDSLLSLAADDTKYLQYTTWYGVPPGTHLILLMRQGWACWRKQSRQQLLHQQQQDENESNSSKGNATNSRDVSHATGTFYCPICDSSLNSLDQFNQHRWYKDKYTGATRNSRKHYKNFERALAAAQSCRDKEVSFQPLHGDLRSVSRGAILEEFKRMFPNSHIPPYLQEDTEAEEVDNPARQGWACWRLQPKQQPLHQQQQDGNESNSGKGDATEARDVSRATDTFYCSICDLQEDTEAEEVDDPVTKTEDNYGVEPECVQHSAIKIGESHDAVQDGIFMCGDYAWSHHHVDKTIDDLVDGADNRVRPPSGVVADMSMWGQYGWHAIGHGDESGWYQIPWLLHSNQLT